MPASTTEHSYSGPIDYLVVAFPPGAPTAEGLNQLLQVVDRGLVEVLDLECVIRGVDGAGQRGVLTKVVSAEATLDLSVFEGVESGILDQEDLDTIASALVDGGFALALVYISHTLDAVADAWLRAGGAPVLAGGIDPDDLDLALGAGDEQNPTEEQR